MGAVLWRLGEQLCAALTHAAAAPLLSSVALRCVVSSHLNTACTLTQLGLEDEDARDPPTTGLAAKPRLLCIVFQSVAERTKI